MTKLVGIVGTNSKESTNRKLLEYIQAAFFYKSDLDLIEIKDVPLIDYREGNDVPEVVQKIADQIEEADGVIIATPEYDHSPTASLINLLAWFSYRIHPLSHKPVMIVGASHGSLGSSRAQQVLRQMLKAPEVNAQVLGSEFLLGNSKNAFDDMGDLKNRDKIHEMENIFDEFLIFTKMINEMNKDNLISVHEFDNFRWDEINWEEK